MPFLKVKFLEYDSNESLNQWLKDGYFKLGESIRSGFYKSFIVRESSLSAEWNQLQSKIKSLSEENKQLKNQLLQKETTIADLEGQLTGSTDKHKERLKSLQKDIKNLTEENKRLSDSLKNQDKLINENKRLSKDLEEKSKIVDDKLTIQEIFNRWGTFQSLQKDMAIIRYFMDRTNETIRQKTICEYFKSIMSVKTCREHLYKLVDKKILLESYEFKGSYIFRDSGFSNISFNALSLIEKLMGPDILGFAEQQWERNYIDNQSE